MEKKHVFELSSKYKRTIGTTLTHLDRVVCEFEEWAKGRQRHSVLYFESNDLSSPQCEALLAQVVEIRELLSELKSAFGLQEHVESVTQSIWSHCSSLWATLSEIDSKHLKGYGDAVPGFAEYWAPRGAEIEAHLDLVLNILRKR